MQFVFLIEYIIIIVCACLYSLLISRRETFIRICIYV